MLFLTQILHQLAGPRAGVAAPRPRWSGAINGQTRPDGASSAPGRGAGCYGPTACRPLRRALSSRAPLRGRAFSDRGLPAPSHPPEGRRGRLPLRAHKCRERPTILRSHQAEGHVGVPGPRGTRKKGRCAIAGITCRLELLSLAPGAGVRGRVGVDRRRQERFHCHVKERFLRIDKVLDPLARKFAQTGGWLG